MATMLLVRHGQSSWFEENYDRLSTVGEAQSRLLGERWAGGGLEVTRVFTGPRLRQVRSAELCGEAYSANGRRWPAPVVLEDLDEMRIEPLFREQMPELFERHAHLRALGDSMLAAGGDEARARIMGRLIEGVITLWVKGQIAAAADREGGVDAGKLLFAQLQLQRPGVLLGVLDPARAGDGEQGRPAREEGERHLPGCRAVRPRHLGQHLAAARLRRGEAA